METLLFWNEAHQIRLRFQFYSLSLPREPKGGGRGKESNVFISWWNEKNAERESETKAWVLPCWTGLEPSTSTQPTRGHICVCSHPSLLPSCQNTHVTSLAFKPQTSHLWRSVFSLPFGQPSPHLVVCTWALALTLQLTSFVTRPTSLVTLLLGPVDIFVGLFLEWPHCSISADGQFFLKAFPTLSWTLYTVLGFLMVANTHWVSVLETFNCLSLENFSYTHISLLM